jgi:hypothetical protein
MIINFVWAFGYNVLAIPVAAGKQRLQWLMAWYFCLLVAGQQQQQPLSLDLLSQLCLTQLCKQVLISHCSCASRSVAFDNCAQRHSDLACVGGKYVSSHVAMLLLLLLQVCCTH